MTHPIGTIEKLSTPLLTLCISTDMMRMSKKEDFYSLENDNFDFVDDLLDTDIFGSYVKEELDPETLKLLEDF